MTLTEYEAYKLYKKYKHKYKSLMREIEREMDGGSPTKDYVMSKSKKKYVVTFGGTEFDPCSLTDDTSVKDKTAQKIYNQGRGAKNAQQKKAIKKGVKDDCAKITKLNASSKTSATASKKADADKKKAEAAWKKAEQERKTADADKKKKQHEKCMFDCQAKCTSQCSSILR
jgi:hypothetical protein